MILSWLKFFLFISEVPLFWIPQFSKENSRPYYFSDVAFVFRIWWDYSWSAWWFLFYQLGLEMIFNWRRFCWRLFWVGLATGIKLIEIIVGFNCLTKRIWVFTNAAITSLWIFFWVCSYSRLWYDPAIDRPGF